MALNARKVVHDRDHDMEYPSITKDGDRRSAGNDSDGKVYDAVRYFHRRQGAKM